MTSQLAVIGSCALLLFPRVSAAQSVALDTTGVRPGTISVVPAENSVTVTWPDETSQVWRATFSLDPSRPLITSITAGGAAVVTDARPFYRGETGKRRGGWNAFFDDPTSHPEGTRHVTGTFTLRRATARSIGDRVELVFDGMRMGGFEGGVAYTFYPRQPPHPSGSGDDDKRSRRRVLLRRGARHGRPRRSHGRQQHAIRDRVLRHVRRAETRDPQRSSGGA